MPATPQPIGAATADGTSATPAEVTRVLRLGMRIGVVMLASGAQAAEVEASIGSLARALGVHGVQAAVSFSMISVSHYVGDDERPTTILHLVRERTTDFTRLAAVSDIARAIRSGDLDLEAAEAELERLDSAGPPYGRALSFAAPGLSATGSTLMFGGNGLDALVTLVIGLLVQPALAWLDRSTLPPFFRLAIGTAASSALVALFVGLGLEISGGLVLTGSLLRFLPGYALVSGFRDLIDGSIISGSARLAEALLLAAAVAGGTALSLALAASVGVTLTILTTGQAAWGLPASVAASLLAVGTFAVRLDVPRRAVVQAAVAGAAAWLLFRSVAIPYGPVDPSVATLAATILIGALGRTLARRFEAPAALWVVPTILPFLPGLQLVEAMLAETDQARIAGLVGAAGAAFLIGTGVATGDILVLVIRRVRERVVTPAVGAVAGGVDVLVIGPVERAVGRIRPGGVADGPSQAAPGASDVVPREPADGP